MAGENWKSFNREDLAKNTIQPDGSVMTLGPNFNYGETQAAPTNIKAPFMNRNVSDPSVMQPHDWEFGDQWQTGKEDEEGNKFNNVFNMQNFNKYAIPAYNFARGNMGAGVLGGLFGGPVGILAAMFAGKGHKNRRRAKEAARIAEIEKAEEAYQKSKTVAPKPYVAPLGPRGDGGNQGSSMGKGQSPTGSDVAGTPFNIGGLAGLWQR